MQPNDPNQGQSYAQDTEPDVTMLEVAQSTDVHNEPDTPSLLPELQPIQWQAAEYVEQDQTPIWYVGFFAVVLTLMAVAIWLAAWTFVALVPVMAVALILYTHRPPRLVNYTLTPKGLHINDQLHPLGEFKNFGVMDERGMHSLVLVPIKRFRPSLTVYFPTEVGEALVDSLGSYLPMTEVHPDVFDQIIHKLRI